MEKRKEHLEKVRIKKLGVLSLANLFGILYAILGLIFGAIITFISLLGFNTEGGITGMFFGTLSIITFPIAYGIMGWISGIITALLYNVSAKITKGIVLYA